MPCLSSNHAQFPQHPNPANIFPVDALTVRLYDRADELTADAAKITQCYLQNLLMHQDTATVILATGNSQIEFLSKLVSFGELDWSRIIFFHLDEYLGIDANHPASFRRYLRERVEQKVNSAAFHYIDGNTLQPLAECDRYTKLLLSQPIDLCCLGLGGNGHLAFNEPSVTNFQDPYYIKLVKLELSTRQQQVNQGYFTELSAVPQYAFTLTIPAICLAKQIFCFALGKHKSVAVQQMLEKAISPDIPASVLREQLQGTFFLDADSASLLRKSKVKN